MILKLKPSARAKKRYILIKGEKKDIEDSILEYLGMLGWAKASPIFVKNLSDKITLAVNRKEVDNIIASFTLSKNKIEVLKVSGTIKGLRK